jgi:hypothetical protein
MKLRTNHLLQGALLVAQLGNFALTLAPDKYKFIVTGIIGAAQWFVSNQAHWHNPDGEKCTEVYKPELKLKASKPELKLKVPDRSDEYDTGELR